MDVFKKEDLLKLMDREGETSLSFYMPMAKAGKDTLQNPNRLKQLLREALVRLREIGMEETQATQLLQPAEDLLKEYEFWQHQEDGLVLFLSHSLFGAMKVPYTLPHYVAVANAFHLKPLLPYLAEDHPFYLLSLSGNQITFYEASRFHIEKKDIKDLPGSMEEALRFDDPEQSLQYHSGGTDSSGNPITIRHGQGGYKDNKDDRLFRFFQTIDRALHPVLQGQSVPLVLAGVDYYIPIFREANTYPHLMNNNISGNPEHLDPRNLREQGWAIVKPLIDRQKRESLQKLEFALAKNQGANTIERVVPASLHGQISTCFISLNDQQWGTVNEQTDAVELLEKPHHCSKDLLDLVAVHTLAHRGVVYPMKSATEIPGRKPIAAIFRY